MSANAELGAENYGTILRFNSHDAVGLAVTQLPGANALDVDQGRKGGAAEAIEEFPPGIKAASGLRYHDGHRRSIRDVLITLLQAIRVVIVVIYLFLQTGAARLSRRLPFPSR